MASLEQISFDPTNPPARPHWGSQVVSTIAQKFPCRRLQASYWLRKFLGTSRPLVGRFHGGFLEVHPDEVASSVAYFTGFYEREVTIWALHEIAGPKPPDLVIDIGANFGYYPLLFGLRSAGRTRSIAFEPDPTNFKWLMRNISLNKALNIRAFPMAIGNEIEGTVPFRVSSEGRNLWSGVAGRHEHAGDNGQVVDIAVTTLDHFIEREGITEVPLVMIDVEGFEKEVLEGMKAGIARHKYLKIMVEVHPAAFPDSSHVAAMLKTVTDAGYKAFRFRHYPFKEHFDKKPAFYDMRFNSDMLQPATVDDLTEWEHFLLVAPDVSA